MPHNILNTFIMFSHFTLHQYFSKYPINKKTHLKIKKGSRTSTLPPNGAAPTTYHHPFGLRH